MSYLETGDSSDEEGGQGKPQVGMVELTEDEKAAILELCAGLKASGNTFFGNHEYDGALKDYTEAVTQLKKANLPRDVLILLNRSATYLALKRFVPALNDANQGRETIRAFTHRIFHL